MNLLDDVMAELPALQAAAESLMVESCTVKRGATVTPGPKGEDVVGYAETVYEGRCKVQDRDLSPQEEESGSSTVDVLKSTLHFPVSAGPFRSGDVVFMGSDEAPSWRILAGHDKTWQTARRCPVERVS